MTLRLPVAKRRLDQDESDVGTASQSWTTLQLPIGSQPLAPMRRKGEEPASSNDNSVSTARYDKSKASSDFVESSAGEEDMDNADVQPKVPVSPRGGKLSRPVQPLRNAGNASPRADIAAPKAKYKFKTRRDPSLSPRATEAASPRHPTPKLPGNFSPRSQTFVAPNFTTRRDPSLSPRGTEAASPSHTTAKLPENFSPRGQTNFADIKIRRDPSLSRRAVEAASSRHPTASFSESFSPRGQTVFAPPSRVNDDASLRDRSTRSPFRSQRDRSPVDYSVSKRTVQSPAQSPPRSPAGSQPQSPSQSPRAADA